METVYDLWFIREYDHRKDTELHIGTYASESDAQAAAESVKDKPGFRDYPEGFDIVPRRMGLTSWTEGFVTEIGPPPKDADGEAFDLPALL